MRGIRGHHALGVPSTGSGWPTGHLTQEEAMHIRVTPGQLQPGTLAEAVRVLLAPGDHPPVTVDRRPMEAVWQRKPAPVRNVAYQEYDARFDRKK